LRVGGHADLHDRAGLLGGDDDTFHLAFGVGAYDAVSAAWPCAQTV
jgi:hypothetical protein